MEMDAEIKRLASLKNKDKSDSLSDKKTSQDGKANSKENATANTWAQFVAQQTKLSSSNAQRKSDKPSDAKNPSVDAASETSPATNAEKPKAKRGRKKIADVQTANATENAATTPKVKQAETQKASSDAKPAPASKPKANTAAPNQPKSNATPSDQNPPKAKRGQKPKALQSANSQANNEAAKSKEVSAVQVVKANKAAKTAKSAAQPKDSVKPAEKTAKAATQAKAEAKPVLKAPAKTPSSGKSSAKAIQAALPPSRPSLILKTFQIDRFYGRSGEFCTLRIPIEAFYYDHTSFTFARQGHLEPYGNQEEIRRVAKDWDKMMLSHAAMRALFMDNPDVILTIDKLKVISRDHKHPQNRKDPYGRKIWYLPNRYLRPEYEYTVKPKEKPTWEEMAKEYRSKRNKSSRCVTSAQKENRKIQLCHRHFYVDEYMELMATKPKEIA